MSQVKQYVAVNVEGMTPMADLWLPETPPVKAMIQAHDRFFRVVEVRFVNYDRHVRLILEEIQ